MNYKLRIIHGVIASLLLMLTSCNKADEFKDTLDNIPQISNATGYKYKSSYVLGDTITITGILHPDKNLRIEIGNVTATILSMDTIYYGILNGAGIMQQAHLIITKDMGIGKKRSVVVYNGTNSVTGASINIYDKGGEGSFDNPLQFTDVLPSAGRQNVYLSCINGKGDIYYYNFLENSICKLTKDGTVTTLLSTAELTTDQNETFNVQNFIAGGVNPQGTTAYVSLQTESDYRFCQLDLTSKTVTTINTTTSSDISSPYEGKLSNMNTIFSGVFPDSAHTVYVFIGTTRQYPGQNAKAVASYDTQTKAFNYLFKTSRAQSDMPGVLLTNYFSSSSDDIRIYPQEKTLFYFFNYLGTSSSGIRAVSRYSLSSRIKINEFTSQTVSGSSNIGSFTGISFSVGNGWGYMPMSGYRLETLYNNSSTSTSNEQWLVMDFRNERTYQNAPGVFTFGTYFIGPTISGSTRIDEMLNYDETGNLYMTANNRSAIVRTISK